VPQFDILKINSDLTVKYGRAKKKGGLMPSLSQGQDLAKKTSTELPSSIDLIGLEQRRIKLALISFGLLAIGILVAISVINYFSEFGKLVWFTMGTAVAIAGCLIGMRLSGQTRLTLHLYGFIMLLMTFCLLYTGGVRGNGHMWIFIFPPVCFFIMGVFYGSLYFAGILGLSVVILFSPLFVDVAFPYDVDFGVRFMMALSGVAGMSYWHEIIRQRTHLALVQSVQRSHEQAHHDELTGLLNRRAGMIMIKHYNHVCRRNAEPFSAMMIDIDYFKKINDAYGHGVGDEVLSGIARELSEIARAQDVCIRWGGEEFLLLLPRTSLDNARTVAYKILERLRQRLHNTSAGSITVTCSIGLAERKPDELLEQSIDRADAQLYVAKREGRNRYIG
jgi:diguanylate cyclase (GGDEF)-like protein